MLSHSCEKTLEKSHPREDLFWHGTSEVFVHHGREVRVEQSGHTVARNWMDHPCYRLPLTLLFRLGFQPMGWCWPQLGWSSRRVFIFHRPLGSVLCVLFRCLSVQSGCRQPTPSLFHSPSSLQNGVQISSARTWCHFLVVVCAFHQRPTLSTFVTFLIW